uniref:ascorbate ferrireductase (transmembrane) n=1 Tax=Culicoides sonorensis TaxID=179676 RepID=A0A336LK63_CULSO
MSSKQPVKSVPVFETFELIINTINHILIGSISIYMTYLCVTLEYKLHNLHVLFSTLGYQLLMCEAILALYSGNAWTQFFTRRQKSGIHFALQILGAGLALSGIGIEIYRKGKLTWKGNHAILGLVSGIFLLINLIIGLMAFWSMKLKNWIKPVYIKLLHNLIGLLCFICGMVSLYYGFEKRLVVQNTTNGGKMYLQIASLITAILLTSLNLKMIPKQNPKKKVSAFEIFEVILNTINHVLIGVITIYMTWLGITVEYQLYNLHVIFCTIGYQFLMAEAILVLYSGNAWSQLLTRRQKSNAHLILQIFGSGIAIAGLGIQIYRKGGLTWKSNHSILGTISGIFLLINLVIGFATFWSMKLKEWIKPVYLKLVHNCLGILCFLFGMVSLYYAFEKKIVINNASNEVKVFLQVSCLITTILLIFLKMNPDQPLKTTSLTQIIEVIVNTVNHVLIGVISIYMTWLCITVEYQLYHLHVLLSTLGYQLLMAEAILTLYSGNSWSQFLSKRQKATIHFVLQVLGSGTAIIGLGIQIYRKGGLTWKSYHSITGTISGIFLLMNLGIGVMTFWSMKIKKWIKPLYLKFTHNLLGILCFSFGMISLYFGFEKRIVIHNATNEVKMFLQISCLITTVIICTGALKTLFHYFKTIIRRNSNESQISLKKF